MPDEINMTPLREAVLRVMRGTGKPLSAYDLTERVAPHLGRKLQPMTVYRALDYLMAHRLVTRIESQNAYWALPPHHADAGSVFCICHQCGEAELVVSRNCEEITDQEAASLGFRVERRVIELQGTCARCLSTSQSADFHPTD